jgi:hypothetical protein
MPKDVSFGKILTELKEGRDALVDYEVLGHGKINTDEKDEKNYYKVWKMKSVDDVGYSDAQPEPKPDDPVQVKRHGAVIELRKLSNQVPLDDLKDFSLAVFDFVKVINSPPPLIPPPPPPDE